MPPIFLGDLVRLALPTISTSLYACGDGGVGGDAESEDVMAINRINDASRKQYGRGGGELRQDPPARDKSVCDARYQPSSKFRSLTSRA